MLGRHAIRAHVAGHFLAFDHLARRRACADGPGRSHPVGLAVSFEAAAEAVPLHGAGESSTFGRADDVDALPHLKDIGLDDLAFRVMLVLSNANLAQRFQRRHIRGELPPFGMLLVGLEQAEMAPLAARQPLRSLSRIESDLNRVVAVLLDGAHLRHVARTSLDYGDRYAFSVLSKDLCHSDFSAEDTLHHDSPNLSLVVKWSRSRVVDIQARSGDLTIPFERFRIYGDYRAARLKLDLDVDASREVQAHQRVDGLRVRINDIDQALVGANLEVFLAVLVDEGPALHCEALDACRQRHRTDGGRACALRRLDDAPGGLIQKTMIVCFQADADSLLDHRLAHLRNQVSSRNLVSSWIYSYTLVMTPAPTVKPPSRIAKRLPASKATGMISFTVMFTLSPGITISTPAGN